MAETVVVKEVTKTDSGWTEVTFEDGRVASTKDQKVADAAFASRGKETDAEINVVQSGKFTNVYLNKIGGVGDSNGKSRAPSRSPQRATRGGGGKSAEEQDRIARQWAYGRVTEIYRDLSDGTFPPSEQDLAEIEKLANWLFDRVK